MDEISGTVDLIVNSIKTKENNRRRKNRRRVKTLINQFEKFSFTSDRATDLRTLLCKDDELQEVLSSFMKEKELNVVLLLDFISDQESRQLKGKQKASSGKAAYRTPKSSLPTSSLDTNTKKSPSKRTLLKKKSDGFVPIDTLISDIEEARTNVDENIWDLPMSDFSRDQIMAYIQGFFGTKRSEIMHSINAHDSTFTQMVSTAVRYWDDKQLIESLIVMIEEVFESSLDSEDTCRWLVNEKVDLAIVLIACFLNDQLMYMRIINILYYVINGPLAVDYNKVMELMLVTHYTLALSEGIRNHSSNGKLRFLTLIHHITLIMELGKLKNCNDEDKQKVKSWLLEESIVDVILMINVHSKPSLENMSPYMYTEEEIAWKSTFLLDWLKEELNPIDILPFFPITLDLMNNPLLQQPFDMRNQLIAHCSRFLRFFISKKLPFEQRITVLNNESVDKIIHAIDIHPTEEHRILDIFATFVREALFRGETSHSNQQKLDKILEYIVCKIKCHTLPSNDLRVCTTQLFIISSVFDNVCQESMLRLIDDGTLRILLQAFLDLEILMMTDQGKTNLEGHHIGAHEYVRSAVQLMTLEGCQEVRCKVVTVIKELYLVPRNLSNPNLALNFPLLPIPYGP